MAALLACPSCGRSQQLDDKWIGKSGKCPGCGVVVQAVAAPVAPSPPVVQQSFKPHKDKVPWREDNWGIASVALAFFSFWFLASTTVMLMSFSSGAAASGVVAAVCSRNTAMGAIGLILNLLMGVLLVMASQSLGIQD
jgi:hypothetical protein